jgi:hypothetical protein
MFTTYIHTNHHTILVCIYVVNMYSSIPAPNHKVATQLYHTNSYVTNVWFCYWFDLIMTMFRWTAVLTWWWQEGWSAPGRAEPRLLLAWRLPPTGCARWHVALTGHLQLMGKIWKWDIKVPSQSKKLFFSLDMITYLEELDRRAVSALSMRSLIAFTYP